MSDDPILSTTSIEGIDIERIRRLSPEDADEVQRLDVALHGEEASRDHLVPLAEILSRYGENVRSEDLLRSGVLDLGDNVYQALRQLHGYKPEQRFDAAIRDFREQFGLRLVSIHSPEDDVWEYLQYRFHTDPLNTPEGVPEPVSRYLGGPCELELRYEVDGATADVKSLSPKLRDEQGIFLKWRDGLWIQIL